MHSIYFFSGTGNSLSLANQLAESLENSQVLPIKEGTQAKISPELKSIIVVFPVYAYRPPHRVKNFLKALGKENASAPVHVVATCGGGPGDVIPYCKKILRGKLTSGHRVVMPFNFLPYGGPGSPEEQERRLKSAEEQLPEILRCIKEEESYFEPVVKPFRTYINPGIPYKIMYPMIPQFAKQFSSTDQCTGCGTCSIHCPTGNISITDGKPQWSKNCEQCWACLHWCPKEAVEWSNKTQGKPRYRNPQVKRRYLKVLGQGAAS